MTQRQLAEKLNITDKAVSKWERGLGCPDISILPPLAEALEVTVTELLNGKRNTTPSLKENAFVETTLRYANKVTLIKKESVKLIAKIVITVTCLLAIFICIICDMAISSTFTWSLYPIAAVTFFWLVIIPLFIFKKNNVCMSLVSLSVFIIPFLLILNKIIGRVNLMLPLGIPITIVSIIYMWIIYILLSIKKRIRWQMAAFSILLGIPFSIIINYIISKFIKQPIIDIWDIMADGIMILISIVLFFIGNKRKFIASCYEHNTKSS